MAEQCLGVQMQIGTEGRDKDGEETPANNTTLPHIRLAQVNTV